MPIFSCCQGEGSIPINASSSLSFFSTLMGSASIIGIALGVIALLGSYHMIHVGALSNINTLQAWCLFGGSLGVYIVFSLLTVLTSFTCKKRQIPEEESITETSISYTEESFSATSEEPFSSSSTPESEEEMQYSFRKTSTETHGLPTAFGNEYNEECEHFKKYINEELNGEKHQYKNLVKIGFELLKLFIPYPEKELQTNTLDCLRDYEWQLFFAICLLLWKCKAENMPGGTLGPMIDTALYGDLGSDWYRDSNTLRTQVEDLDLSKNEFAAIIYQVAVVIIANIEEHKTHDYTVEYLASLEGYFKISQNAQIQKIAKFINSLAQCFRASEEAKQKLKELLE